MLSRLSFRAKLLLVLFVPFLALVVVAGAGLRDRFAALRAQEQYGELAGPMRALDDLSRALENESVVTSWYVASGEQDPAADSVDVSAELGSARERTNAATKVFRAVEPRFVDAGVSGAALAALRATNDGLDGLPAERRSVDSLDAGAAEARAVFLAVDDDLLTFGERVARDLEDPQASASVGRVFGLQREQQELAREAGIMAAVSATGERIDFGPWVSAIAAQSRERERFTVGATAGESGALESADVGRATATDELPTAFPGTLPDPSTVVEDYQSHAAALDRGIDKVNRVIAAASTARANAAQRDVLVYGGGAVLAMLLTLGLIWFAARAVVRPVRRLTEAAREMSQHQLPQLVELLREGGDLSAVEPTRIEVTSEDEIGELAQAFNDVESVTLEVARQQSRLLRKGMGDLFVNLARRNQSLLQRQLELLDDLERNEHDPGQLDALFKLDHMATRMRRNAESLLVLSGAEQPRQWQQPVTLLDVVRSASAEIADFPRVDLVGVDDELAVSGRAVADLAHLLAELLENATSFSPPESAVVVSGATTSNGFVLAITDQGIGMPPEKVAEANALLAKPPVVGLALSRALGLHVVGSLAARHGITVELRPGAPLGLVALVTLPSAILENQTVAPAADPVFAPDVGPDGEPVPLGARRVAWRPPDEPPVEEWRAEGLADPEPAHAPPVQTVTLPPPDEIPAETAAPGPPDPVEVPPTADIFDEPQHDAFTGTAEEPAPQPEAPLPTRVPGHHLSHQPAPDSDDPLRAPAPTLETDPLRPYRVHELLTRHDLGKRRGRAERDGDPEAPDDLTNTDRQDER
jgi:signal transduction histidine kinase